MKIEKVTASFIHTPTHTPTNTHALTHTNERTMHTCTRTRSYRVATLATGASPGGATDRGKIFRYEGHQGNKIPGADQNYTVRKLSYI